MIGKIASIDAEIGMPKVLEEVATIRDPNAVIVKAVVRAFEQWKLTNADSAGMFDVSSATLSRMKAGKHGGELDVDSRTRASLIVGIFKALRLLFNGPLTFGWPTMPNRGVPFNGRTPVQYMVEGGIPAMMQVRRHLDGLRGGL
jgi:hypothetical protein